MKIALVGSRGIPARYSGFEQFYEQLAVRLAERGHKVTVYNRSHVTKDVGREYRGVRIVLLPSIATKHLDTITHTTLSSLHALSQRYDIVYYCIVGNSPLIWLPRIAGSRVLINVDGEDWSRPKWSGFARAYQKWCEKVACRLAHIVIADAKGILTRYRDMYRHEAVFVPYGAAIQTTMRVAGTHDATPEPLTRYGLRPDDYIFYVGRLVPENAIDLLIRAFRRVKTRKKLVIVGDAPYVDTFKDSLYELAKDDNRVVFTGYAFGVDYAHLSANAYCSVQPSGIEGTRPALLDQMGFGNCVLVRNSPVNMEVISACGRSFDEEQAEESLTHALQELVDNPAMVADYRTKATTRIRNYYNWDWITSFYEDLFSRLIAKRGLIQYDDFIKTQKRP